MILRGTMPVSNLRIVEKETLGQGRTSIKMKLNVKKIWKFSSAVLRLWPVILSNVVSLYTYLLIYSHYRSIYMTFCFKKSNRGFLIFSIIIRSIMRADNQAQNNTPTVFKNMISRNKF